MYRLGGRRQVVQVRRERRPHPGQLYTVKFFDDKTGFALGNDLRVSADATMNHKRVFYLGWARRRRLCGGRRGAET